MDLRGAEVGPDEGVRDSKLPHGPILVFGASPWVAFLADVKGGRSVHPDQ
ncbi:DUF397 domain-containing protein [Streptomyces collinus]|uniref:DUF397 domain-containing protein n=1 Tax=Streptomyces collinus TaxID=42684 RepID=A0AA89Q7Z2_STRCU|nr:DUF397 domain-containing protein [Streptomyces collinus]MBB5812091.1 hypothetical protein [Streptomyces collinus]WMX65271.1 DUF397 domain-containing protein [Streptomyces collinus]